MSLSLASLSSSRPCSTLASSRRGSAARQADQPQGWHPAYKHGLITNPSRPATPGGGSCRSDLYTASRIARVICRAADEVLELSEDNVEQALQVCTLLGQDT